MGRLDAPRNVVTVYPSSDGLDEFDAPVRVAGDPSTAGVKVRCTVTRTISTDVTAVGEVPAADTAERRFIVGRRLDFGAASVVLHEGRLWDVLTEPVWVRDGSHLSRRMRTEMRARTGTPR